jgi:hypothetical protein
MTVRKKRIILHSWLPTGNLYKNLAIWFFWGLRIWNCFSMKNHLFRLKSYCPHQNLTKFCQEKKHSSAYTHKNWLSLSSPRGQFWPECPSHGVIGDCEDCLWDWRSPALAQWPGSMNLPTQGPSCWVSHSSCLERARPTSKCPQVDRQGSTYLILF